MKTQWFYKVSAALMIVMLAVTALPVTPAYAATSGPNLPGTGTNVNGPGAVNWTNPGNILTNNNAYATVNVNNSISEYLQATNFGFSIPAGATINGIQVAIGRFGTTNPGSDVRDSGVQLLKAGTIVGSNLADTLTDWPNGEAIANYGAANNLWATTWTPAEINAADFGVSLAVNSTNARTASVDYIQVTVTYTLIHTITVTSGAGGTITPAGPSVLVTDGANQTFVIAPSANNIVNDVLVDGVSQGRRNTYTFTNVTAPHTITASFDSGWFAPTVNSGGAWITEANAYTSNNISTTGGNGGDTTDFSAFNFGVPSGSIINGIAVAAEGSTTGRDISVQLSVDGGTNFTAARTINFTTNAAEETILSGNSSDLWGLAAPADTGFSNANFRLKVTATNGGGTFSLDQIQVKVYYTSIITTTLTVSPATGTFGGTALVSATLAPNVAGKTINFTLNGTSVGSAVTNASGVASIAAASLSGINVNTYPAGVAASFAGDAGYSASNGTAALTVNPGSQTISFTSVAPVAAVVAGATYTTAATATSGLPVTLTIDASASAVCSISAGVVSFQTAGTCVINANQAGNANYNAASQVQQSFTVNPGSQTISFTSVAPVAAVVGGSTYTPAATATSGLPVTLTIDASASAVCSISAGVVSFQAVGTCVINANQAGNANYNAASQVQQSFSVGIGSQTISFTSVVPVAAMIGGSTYTPTATATSGLPVTLTIDASASAVCSISAGVVSFQSVGTCVINADQAGNANYNAASQIQQSFAVGIGSQTISFTTSAPVAAVVAGATYTPAATATSGLPVTLTIDASASAVCSISAGVVSFQTAGTCVINANQAGNANYNAASQSQQSFAVGLGNQIITVTTSAPGTASNGSTFDVAATATSGLPVTITTSGGCTGGDTDGDATITMTSGTVTCVVSYNQAGNANYAAATLVQENALATEGPVFTSANNTSFDFGLPGSFTVSAVGNPLAMTITLGGPIPAGVSLTNNGNGTETLSSTAATPVGVYSLLLTANNGVAPNATQIFTLTVKNGPVIGANGINSTPDTGDNKVSENESIIDTLGITKLTVEFSQDVYDDPADVTDYGHDVTNPANYILVRSTTNSFATIDCAGGVVAPDVSIKVNSVAYSNGGGSGPYVATLSINDGFPLNVVGFYRLYVCGTTSIVDANNRLLELAGNGTTPGTDFLRNFRIATAVVTNDGGGRGASSTSTKSVVTNGFLIPVTGFAPNQVTTLPIQPAGKMYTSMGQMTIEIPSLGVKFPIVGASITNKTWDLTWLKDSVAYLEGSAYPTTAGNTVLTAHVHDANKNLGPFSDIKGMQAGQNIYIHVNGQVYVYQVQENSKIASNSIASMFKHEEDSWITLVTCEDYNAKTGVYSSRRMVRAVLISVIFEK